MARDSVEARVTKLHLKLTGCGLGLYQPSAKSFRDGLESEGVYQSNLEIVRQCLKSGWVAADLEEAIRAAYRGGTRAALLSEVVGHRRGSSADPEDELLEVGVVYQHPLLWVRTPPAPGQPGKLAPRLSFKLHELVAYYESRVTGTRANPAAVLGAFKHLLQCARVDELLFAIDFAAGADYPVSVLKLADYLVDAGTEVRYRQARARS